MSDTRRMVSLALIGIIGVLILALGVVVFAARTVTDRGSDAVDRQLNDARARIEEVIEAIEGDMATTTLPSVSTTLPAPDGAPLDAPANEALWQTLEPGNDAAPLESMAMCAPAGSTTLSTGGVVESYVCGTPADPVIVNAYEGEIILRSRQVVRHRGSMTAAKFLATSDAATPDEISRDSGPCFEERHSVAGATTRLSLVCGNSGGTGGARFEFENSMQVGRAEDNLG